MLRLQILQNFFCGFNVLVLHPLIASAKQNNDFLAGIFVVKILVLQNLDFDKTWIDKTTIRKMLKPENAN